MRSPLKIAIEMAIPTNAEEAKSLIDTFLWLSWDEKVAMKRKVDNMRDLKAIQKLVGEENKEINYPKLVDLFIPYQAL